jgi:mRNA interferase MazF
VVRQGDVYWLDVGLPSGSEPGGLRPFVVVQNDLFNERGIATTVVCGVTSNLRRAAAPGNVLLDTGEGGLKRRSVVNVTQLYTVDKLHLTDAIGRLSRLRIQQILEGIHLVHDPV